MDVRVLNRNGTRSSGDLKYPIRTLQAEDQQCVQAIMKPHPLQFPQRIIDIYPERWARFLTGNDMSDNGYYVAVADGALVGHAGFIYNSNEQMYEIVGVIVKADVQGSGVGTVLLNTVCDNIMSMGKSQVMLYTLEHPGNALTLRFYERLGFVEVAHDADFWGEGYHRVQFIKDIK